MHYFTLFGFQEILVLHNSSIAVNNDLFFLFLNGKSVPLKGTKGMPTSFETFGGKRVGIPLGAHAFLEGVTTGENVYGPEVVGVIAF